jgi:hypothetical protein
VASKPTAKEKPTCHVRRHLTPSQFMTYDAMRAMAKEDDCGDLICYAKKTTISNHTSLRVNQTGDNIKALVEKGWLVPEDKVRWRAGRWANNRYLVREHADYEKQALHHEEGYTLCPPFKYDAKTGEVLTTAPAPNDEFAFRVEARRWSKENRVFIDALKKVLAEMTDDEREAWVTQLRDEATASEYSDTVEEP